MRKLLFIFSLSAAYGLSACTQSTGAADSHLNCAALISAANHLSGAKKLKTDSEFDNQALVSSMTYLASYAIPQNIREDEAFERVNARREDLIDSISPETILKRAKTCIRNTPSQ